MFLFVGFEESRLYNCCWLNRKLLVLMIPKDFIQTLNSRLNIVDVVKRYVPDLKKKGANYSACCPFHEEKSPSFTVNEQKNFYHCFGCPAHGNSINFVMEFTGQTFQEAVHTLAQSIGMEVPDDRATPAERSAEEKALAIRYRRAHELLKHACEVYEKNLKENEEAMAYLTERGVSLATIEKFHIGYAPNEWGTITNNRSFIRETMLDSGLGKQKEGSSHVYDRFRDRIMFPIYSRSGENIVGFGGRITKPGQDAKYLNSPECLVFQKGEHLYGLKQAQDAIRTAKRVFVVEGYMDCDMMSQYEVENVVATLGTAVTEAQLKLLLRHASHITFCFDGDRPGQAAAIRTAELCLSEVDETRVIDFIFLPNELDPDEFMREYGKTQFEELASNALTLTDFLLKDAASTANMSNSESLARYLSRANEMAEKVTSAIVKLSFQKRVAELAGISLDAMLNMLQTQNQHQETVPIVPPQKSEPILGKPEISVSAKMIAVCAIKARLLVVNKLDLDFLGKYFGAADREMLFPLLAYLKANPDASHDAIIQSLAFNPYSMEISNLVLVAQKLLPEFDAFHEAKKAVEQIRAFDKIYTTIISEAVPA